MNSNRWMSVPPLAFYEPSPFWMLLLNLELILWLELLCKEETKAGPLSVMKLSMLLLSFGLPRAFWSGHINDDWGRFLSWVGLIFKPLLWVMLLTIWTLWFCSYMLDLKLRVDLAWALKTPASFSRGVWFCCVWAVFPDWNTLPFLGSDVCWLYSMLVNWLLGMLLAKFWDSPPLIFA